MKWPKASSILRIAPVLPRRTLIALPFSALMSSASRQAMSQTYSAGAALPQLSYAGVELTSLTVDPAHADISIIVDLAGDRPMASYMAARPRGLPALQRTATGDWVLWDQRTQSLIDNRFSSSGGHIVFAVAGANLSRQSFPLALEIAYRTPAGVKFGVLTLTSKR
ncbi:MAG: hypothetical protein JOY83_26445 [Alphaproteobacteria bacterium]|nr:hypothetical protein [Alphaproteobacteria bacterium]